MTTSANRAARRLALVLALLARAAPRAAPDGGAARAVVVLRGDAFRAGTTGSAGCELAPQSGAVCDDLLTILVRRSRLAESDARRVFTRLVLAAKRAHDCGAVLRNIKPESIQVRQ